MSRSPSSDAPRAAKRESVVSMNRVASGPTSTSYSPPIRASASDTSSALSDPVPSSTMSAVMAASPSLIGRIGARAAVDLHDDGDDRHAVVLDGAHIESVRERVPHDRGQPERRIGTDRRQPRAIDTQS